eukprot:763687-Pyramimonas_sp.AAC.1
MGVNNRMNTRMETGGILKKFWIIWRDSEGFLEGLRSPSRDMETRGIQGGRGRRNKRTYIV